MTSQNEWYVCGEIAEINNRKRSVVVSIKGKIFRPNIFNMHGKINCILTKEQYDSLNIYKDVEFTGHMVFGKKNYLLVETVKNKVEMLIDSIMESRQLA